MKRVNHDCEVWSRPKIARFERSKKCLRWEDIPELRGLLCGCAT